MSDGCWLVWSREHNAWWRPNSAGYTDNVFNAGRYAEWEARDICRGGRDPQRDGSPSEVAIPAPELSHIFARRVWAAWNACQGIETEELENISEPQNQFDIISMREDALEAVENEE